MDITITYETTAAKSQSIILQHVDNLILIVSAQLRKRHCPDSWQCLHSHSGVSSPKKEVWQTARASFTAVGHSVLQGKIYPSYYLFCVCTRATCIVLNKLLTIFMCALAMSSGW